MHSPLLLSALLVVLLPPVSPAPIRRDAPSSSTRSYAVILDGGSTGTRVHVFSWASGSLLGGANSPNVDGLPDVRSEPGGNLKVKPGISAFESSPEDAGASITPLIELAERVVPASEHGRTLVMLRATAGMRLLSRRRAQRIYTSLFDAIARRGTFRPRRQDFGTLSGDDEGVFGWLCANYLLRRSGRIPEMGALGALDLGGGSTQITLVTPGGRRDASQLHAHDRSQIDPRHGVEERQSGAPAPTTAPTVALPAGDVRVFTHSHLGYGNKAVLSSLSEAEASACLAEGVNASWEPCNRSRDYQRYLQAGAVGMTLRGEGHFERCDAAVRRVLGTFDRAGQPTVHPRARFVAMSLFFYVKHFAQSAGHLPAAAAAAGGGNGSGGESTLASAAALREAARALCEYDDAKLRTLVGRDPLTTEDALRWRCFDLTYAARLLTDGYGFEADAAVIDFMGDVDGVEVEWTLGALLNELMLEAKEKHGGMGGGMGGHGGHGGGGKRYLDGDGDGGGGGGGGGGYGHAILQAAIIVAVGAAILCLAPRLIGGASRRNGRSARLSLAKW